MLEYLHRLHSKIYCSNLPTKQTSHQYRELCLSFTAVETYLSRQDKYIIITYPRQCQQHLETRKFNVHFLVKARPRDQKNSVSEEWSIKKIIPITLLGRAGQHHPPIISTDNYNYQEETNYEDTRDADDNLVQVITDYYQNPNDMTCKATFNLSQLLSS
jgi:hypothetical protein